LEEKTAENPCLDFGCWKERNFAKVSIITGGGALLWLAGNFLEKPAEAEAEPEEEEE